MLVKLPSAKSAIKYIDEWQLPAILMVIKCVGKISNKL